MLVDRPKHTSAAQPPRGSRVLTARGPPLKVQEFPVVGIGASAGGLDACRKLVGALAAGNGMAFILIQHLDPTHESMMVDLLSGPHVDDGAASNRWNADRARPSLCHSSRNLSLCRRWRVASSRNPRRAMARGCRSTFFFTPWPISSVRLLSALFFLARGPTAASGSRPSKKMAGS